ncbi:MAG: DNA-binding protein [archaeon]|nr:MAG: DNA-binding protein [archaeon]
MAKIYSLKEGSKIPGEILRLAAKEGVRTASVEGIGAVRRLKLAYYNPATKKYEEHRYAENLEVTSLLGNITTKDGAPFLHAHATLGRRDMSVIGGHLLSAEVHPLLEVVITKTTNDAVRRFDEELGLNLIYKTS